MKKHISLLLVFCLLLMSVLCSSCSRKKKLTSLDTPYELLEKSFFTSKWKRFTVTHPSGFWQVIKKEKWTLLYNNQDVSVQMIVDAHRHFFKVPNSQKMEKSFFKSFKIRDMEIVNQDKKTVNGIPAQRTIVNAKIMFDYWDSYLVNRKLEVYTLTKNRCSYLIAYIADKENFDKYHKDFDVLLDNFKTISPKKSGKNTQ